MKVPTVTCSRLIVAATTLEKKAQAAKITPAAASSEARCLRQGGSTGFRLASELIREARTRDTDAQVAEVLKSDPILRLKANALKRNVTLDRAKCVNIKSATLAGIPHPELLQGVLAQCAELLGKQSSVAEEMATTKQKFGDTAARAERLAMDLKQATVQLRRHATTELKMAKHLGQLEREWKKVESALRKQVEVSTKREKDLEKKIKGLQPKQSSARESKTAAMLASEAI